MGGAPADFLWVLVLLGRSSYAKKRGKGKVNEEGGGEKRKKGRSRGEDEESKRERTWHQENAKYA